MISVSRSTGKKLKRCLPWSESGTARQPASPPPPLLAAMLESHQAAAGPLAVRAPATTPSCWRQSVIFPVLAVMNQWSSSVRAVGVSIRCGVCNKTQLKKDNTSGPVLNGVCWLVLAPARLVICRVFSVRPPTCVRCRRPSRTLPPPQQDTALTTTLGNTRRLSSTY